MRQPCNTFTNSVWNRLMAPAGNAATALTLHQLKQAITRDLENLLNTRSAVPEADLAALPHCRRSIANFGLADFADLSLSSSVDAKDICDRLEAAITCHEPRLAQVKAQLVREPGAVNRLGFVITARLKMPGMADQLRFDVLLEPSSLHYTIR